MQDQQVIIKFKTGGLDFKHAPGDYLNKMVGHPVFAEVKPLFPGNSDEEMASVYIATVVGNPAISAILDSLNTRAEIDYVHVPSPRKGM